MKALGVLLAAALAVGCGAPSSGLGPGDRPPDGTAPGPISPPLPGDRRTEPAPIDRAEVGMTRSVPPHVTLALTVGLPNGCARYHSSTVERRGETIIVTVLNSFPKGDVACTMIYGTHDLSIPLGSDFRPNTEYTVRVNDRTITFRT